MSEFSIINQYFKSLTHLHHYTQLGIGDDCAISQIPSDQQLVSCVDVLVAGRHFPIQTSPYAIGFKAVAVNLSDLAAMGAKPYAILLGLSLPQAFAHEAWIKPFCQGIQTICQKFNVELIGGDTTKSDILTISITALGTVPQHQAIVRSGAKVNDLICVSGEIGSASFALQQILNHQTSPLQARLDLPEPQVELGQQLRNYANSMIDISDGLAQDLRHILNSSQVGATLFLEKIPSHPLLQSLPLHEKWQYQLNGGDDYQLCFTMPEICFNYFNQQYTHPIFAIGQITQNSGITLLYHGDVVQFNLKGWQHF